MKTENLRRKRELKRQKKNFKPWLWLDTSRSFMFSCAISGWAKRVDEDRQWRIETCLKHEFVKAAFSIESKQLHKENCWKFLYFKSGKSEKALEIVFFYNLLIHNINIDDSQQPTDNSFTKSVTLATCQQRIDDFF